MITRINFLKSLLMLPFAGFGDKENKQKEETPIIPAIEFLQKHHKNVDFLSVECTVTKRGKQWHGFVHRKIGAINYYSNSPYDHRWEDHVARLFWTGKEWLVVAGHKTECAGESLIYGYTEQIPWPSWLRKF